MPPKIDEKEGEREREIQRGILVPRNQLILIIINGLHSWVYQTDEIQDIQNIIEQRTEGIWMQMRVG